MKDTQRAPTLLLIAKIAISATLLFLALRGMNLHSAAARLAGMQWGWFDFAVTRGARPDRIRSAAMA